MPWCPSPTRRETALVLFSLTIFVLFYNLESSLSGDIGRSHIANDTLVTDAAAGEWDDLIYGNWTWEEDQVAKNHKTSAEEVLFPPHVFGTVGVNDGIRAWGADVPRTRVLAHAPGYTVLDNVFMLNGTVFLVSDDGLSLEAIVEVGGEGAEWQVEWRVISSREAKETLGTFGGVIHGVSWLVTDVSPNNHTLFSLWRTYTALSSNTVTLPPPRRLFFPNIPTFTGSRPDPNGPVVLRQRSPSGFHPLLPKAAFPTLGLLYSEDWSDYALLHAPFLMHRVVVADERAARRARGDISPFALALEGFDKGDKAWWEPIRRNVARYVGVPEAVSQMARLGKREVVVTYLSVQETDGPRLREADHEALLGALGGLGVSGEGRYRVQVVEGALWMARIEAIAQSTIVIGVYGAHMADGVYVPPGPGATVMEVFPPGVFVRDVALAVGAVDVGYMAWWEGRQFGADGVPEGSVQDLGEGVEVPLDVDAVVQAIRRVG